jgi:hypothetical protein
VRTPDFIRYLDFVVSSAWERQWVDVMGHTMKPNPGGIPRFVAVRRPLASEVDAAMLSQTGRKQCALDDIASSQLDIDETASCP